MTDRFATILSAVTGPVAIFTDFDGTLVEIAQTPEAIIVAETLPGQLAQLHAALGGALAIVTGRTISDIDRFLPGAALSISGSHGAEQRHAGRLRAPPAFLLDQAEQISAALVRSLGDETGILVEQKPTGVAVHYRAAPEKKELVHKAVQNALSGRVDFHSIDGKMVVEARPRSADKGGAIRTLMAKPPFAGRRPVFLGDDVTDEDGFAAVRQLDGYGIKIGPGETSAQYRLADSADVQAFFDRLIERYGEAEPEDISQPCLQGEFAQ